MKAVAVYSVWNENQLMKKIGRIIIVTALLLVTAITGSGADRQEIGQVGFIDISDKWANFGAYLQNFADTVEMEWRIRQPVLDHDAVVRVHIKFCADGEISSAKIVGHELLPLALRTACLKAVTAHSPYRPWSAEMRACLGNIQEFDLQFCLAAGKTN